MYNFTNIVLIIIIIIDLIFYIPIPIHFYGYKNIIYLSIFSFLIIKKDEKDDKNLLKDKITIQKLSKADTKNIKLVQSIKLKKINIDFNEELIKKYPYIFYPLYSLNNDVIKININTNNKVYIKIEIKLINVLLDLISIRRNKHERKSN